MHIKEVSILTMLFSVAEKEMSGQISQERYTRAEFVPEWQQKAGGTNPKTSLFRKFFSLDYLLRCDFYSAFAASTHMWSVKKKQYWLSESINTKSSPWARRTREPRVRAAIQTCRDTVWFCFLFSPSRTKTRLTSWKEESPKGVLGDLTDLLHL